MTSKLSRLVAGLEPGHVAAVCARTRLLEVESTAMQCSDGPVTPHFADSAPTSVGSAQSMKSVARKLRGKVPAV